MPRAQELHDILTAAAAASFRAVALIPLCLVVIFSAHRRGRPDAESEIAPFFQVLTAPLL